MFFKVYENSVAEKSGLKVGDEIIRMNDIDVTVLNHQEVHEIVSSLTNSFEASIIRESDSVINEPNSAEVESITDATEKHIAEIISAEAELLKDHNVIG